MSIRDIMSRTVAFVIGANATGKTTFIKNNFSDNDAVILNVYNYQQKVYKDAGFGGRVPFSKEFECLYQANENLLVDIIDNLKQGKDVVVEQTLFKAKRRIEYIDRIKDNIENVNIEFFVMCPSDVVWEEYITKRQLHGSFQIHKGVAEQFEFPNPSEGIDRIYEVVDNVIRLRMDTPNPEIVDAVRNELKEESERILQEQKEKEQKVALLESMNTRPFWHYCEVCGKKVYATAQTTHNDGWDYPPKIGHFGMLGPRNCGDCSMTDTLFWKVQQQKFPIVVEKMLTESELKTWQRIKNEPETLLVEEK